MWCGHCLLSLKQCITQTSCEIHSRKHVLTLHGSLLSCEYSAAQCCEYTMVWTLLPYRKVFILNNIMICDCWVPCKQYIYCLRSVVSYILKKPQTGLKAILWATYRPAYGAHRPPTEWAYFQVGKESLNSLVRIELIDPFHSCLNSGQSSL